MRCAQQFVQSRVPSSTRALPHPTTTFPPGARDTTSGVGVARTVVAKVRGGLDHAAHWASPQTGVGQIANSVACVRLDADEGTSFCYVVLTENKPRHLGSVSSQMKRTLTGPCVDVVVDLARPLDRRLTRLFGWGDVWADAEQLGQAVTEDPAPPWAPPSTAARHSSGRREEGAPML